MPTECSPDRMEFAPVEGRAVVAAFDGGTITSDAGALLLGATDRAIGLVRRFAACFVDHRCARAGRAQRGDPGRPARVRPGAGLRGPGRPRHPAPRPGAGRGHRQAQRASRRLRAAGRQVDPQPARARAGRGAHALPQDRPRRGRDRAAVRRAVPRRARHRRPSEIVLDLDATDDPLHGDQEGRFFHGYYGCYCYLPLYVFCGDHLLAAKLRRSNIDASAGAVEEVARIVAQIRARWPQVRIVLRADSGFARDGADGLVRSQRVDYVLGLARNSAPGAARSRPSWPWPGPRPKQTGKAARCFKDFRYQTLDSWSRARRVVGKAEQLVAGDGATSANPRFVVTSLAAEAWPAQAALRAALLRPRRDGEPDQGVPARPVRRPHLRPGRCGPTSSGCGSPRWPTCCSRRCGGSACRRPGWPSATAGTIRLKLLKIGALVRVSVRRVTVAMASGHPWQRDWAIAHAALTAAAG